MESHIIRQTGKIEDMLINAKVETTSAYVTKSKIDLNKNWSLYQQAVLEWQRRDPFLRSRIAKKDEQLAEKEQQLAAQEQLLAEYERSKETTDAPAEAEAVGVGAAGDPLDVLAGGVDPIGIRGATGRGQEQ